MSIPARQKFFMYALPSLMMLSLALASPAQATVGLVTITSCEDFKSIGNDGGHPLSGFYRLANDLNCGEDNAAMVGSDPWAPFTGDFDGGNHKITVTVSLDEPNVGLFRATSGARIHDLHVLGSLSGNSVVGALIGHDHSSTNIVRVSSDASVTSTAGNQVGGLVGYGQSTVIRDSYATGAVTGAALSIGGLVGLGSALQITDSYATGAVTSTNDGAQNYVGGLIGQTGSDAPGSIANDFSTGLVTANGYTVGGLVGGMGEESSPFSNDYFDAFTSGRSECVGDSTGACTAVNAGNEQPNYFKNTALNAPLDTWNFIDVWQKTEIGPPVLQSPPTPYTAEYWNLPSAIPAPPFPVTAPNLTRNDNAIFFNWGSGSPDPSIHADGFVARWTKSVTLTNAMYRFDTLSDDGIRVYVDGALLIDKWIEQGDSAYTTNIHLTTGTHLFKVEYYENGGGATAHFSITSTNLPTPPELSVVTPVPTPSTTADTLDFTFNTTEAGGLTYGGGCTGATTRVEGGATTISFNALPAGTYSDCTLRLHGDETGLDSDVLAVPSFIVTAEPAAGDDEVTPPIVTLVQPKGGQTLSGGSTSTVVWSSSGEGIATYRVSFSKDGGTSWSVVTDGLAGNTFAWIVPSVCTTTAKVRVDGLDIDGVVEDTDQSPSNFTTVSNGCSGTLAPTTSSNVGEGGGGAPSVSGQGEGSGLEGADTSSSGKGAMTHDEANSHLPAAYHFDSLVKLANDGNAGTETDTTVYYLGLDAKRHPFINPTAYFSWETDFSQVKTIDSTTLASIPLGAPIMVRPGTHWVKIVSDPRTYYVEPGYKLRLIKDEATAVKLGGPDWNKNIVDVDVSFFALFSAGPDIDLPYLLTTWPAGMIIQSSLNFAEDRDLLGLKYYVTGPTPQSPLGTRRIFRDDLVTVQNHFQKAYVRTVANAADAIRLKSLPPGPDITGQEDALFSLLH